MMVWEQYADWVVRRRRTALLLALVLTAALAVFLKDARLDNSVRALLPAGDPDYEYYLAALDRFGGAEVLAAAFTCDDGDCVSPAALARIDRVTRALQDLPPVQGAAIRHVVSLTNVVGVTGSADTVEIRRLLPAVPGTPAERAALKARVLGDRLYRRDLISPDGRVAAVTAYLDEMPDEERVRVELVRAFAAAARAAAGPEVTVHLAGLSVFTRHMYEDMYRDLRIFPALTVAFVFFLLLWIFRSVGGMLIPHLVILLTLVWTFGLFFLCGRPLNLVSVMLPTVIAVIAMADVVHQLTHHTEEITAGHDNRTAVRRMVAAVGPPCLLTSVTTVIGFASLAVAELRPIQDFGLFAAAGVLGALVLAFLVVPPILLWSRPPRPRVRELFDQGRLTRALVRLSRATLARPRTVALIGLAVVLAAGAGITRLKVETNVHRFLPPDSPARVDLRFFEAHLAGTSLIDVIVEGRRPGALKDPRLLGALAGLQDWLDAQPQVHKSVSVADYVRALNRAFHADDPAQDRIPEAPNAAAQLLFLLEGAGDGDLLVRLVDDEYRAARILCRITMIPTSDQLALLAALDAEVAARIPADLATARITGGVPLYAHTVDRLVRSQLLSFGVAFTLIGLLFVVLFRSLRSALIALVPNLCPILVTVGVMGWAGISLNMATTMIASVSLGIAVDDTIHYLVRVRTERRRDPAAGWAPALERATRFTGRALVATTLAITGGFWILLCSSFQVTRHFGILCGLAVASALVADLVLTPACLYLFRPSLGVRAGRAAAVDRDVA